MISYSPNAFKYHLDFENLCITAMSNPFRFLPPILELVIPAIFHIKLKALSCLGLTLDIILDFSFFLASFPSDSHQSYLQTVPKGQRHHLSPESLVMAFWLPSLSLPSFCYSLFFYTAFRAILLNLSHIGLILWSKHPNKFVVASKHTAKSLTLLPSSGKIYVFSLWVGLCLWSVEYCRMLLCNFHERLCSFHLVH